MEELRGQMNTVLRNQEIIKRGVFCTHLLYFIPLRTMSISSWGVGDWFGVLCTIMYAYLGLWMVYLGNLVL